jgi:5-hydroxyisourate hydrolase
MRIDAIIVDGSYGKPAAKIGVRLERAIRGDNWTVVHEAEAGEDGSVYDMCPQRLDRGLYRIVLSSDSYFARLGLNTAYPEVIVTFRLPDDPCHFQVNAILTPYSYSVYFRGLDIIAAK